MLFNAARCCSTCHATALLLALAAAAQPSPHSPAVVGALRLVVSPSCVVSSLGLGSNFSFTTSELGSLTLRTRTVGSTGDWQETFTKAGDATPFSQLPADEIAAATLHGTGSLIVEQHWAKGSDPAGGVMLWYTLQNDGAAAVELGGLAVSMPANEQTGGNLATLAETASFADPYVGGGHGHLTMTRLTGRDGVLMVLGENGTAMEAFSDQWSPLGSSINAWSVHSKAFYDTDWKDADGSWVTPTSVTIPAGGVITRGFRMVLAEGGVRAKSSALRAAGRPVLAAVPGYIVGMDMQSAQLFVQPPMGATLTTAHVENDARNASTTPCMVVKASQATNKNGWLVLSVAPRTPHCRCRVVLRYSDGTYQVASYYVLPALNKHLATFGKFQAFTAFYEDDSDPFGRSPSVMPWNRLEAAHVLHDPRNFIVGLSDEGGAGANVGFAIKQYADPVQAEVTQLDRYINSTLYGVHCPAAPEEYRKDCSLQDHATNGIKASLFWTNASATWDAMSGMPGYKYEPEDFTGWKWDRPRAYSLFRAYNYPHQTVVYYSMYRLSRDHPSVVTSMPAVWYLKKCADTVRGAWSRLGGLWYMQQGLMAGSVWLDVLHDLQLEAVENPTMFAEDAQYVLEVMANRTLPGRGMGGSGSEYFSSEVCPKSDHSPFQTCSCQNCTSDPANPCKDGVYTNGTKPITSGVRLTCKSWADNPLPYGSEFSWDSTGQEEAYIWGRYFNQSTLADTVLNAILAYDPSTPNWAYYGSALSYGDVGNNAYDPWDSNTHSTHYPLGSGSERVSGHYRAGLNAVPILAEFKRNPDDMYLLRLAVAGLTNCLPNIDANGAASMGFHLSPANLKFDKYSGDWGVGFFAAAIQSSSFVVDDPELGLVCFLCDIQLSGGNVSSSSVTVMPRDAVRRKVFIAALGLDIISEAGRIESVQVAPTKLVVTFEAVASQPLVSVLRLRVAQPAVVSGKRKLLSVTPDGGGVLRRGAWEFQPQGALQSFEVTLNVT